jgi:hypothetical protein
MRRVRATVGGPVKNKLELLVLLIWPTFQLGVPVGGQAALPI